MTPTLRKTFSPQNGRRRSRHSRSERLVGNLLALLMLAGLICVWALVIALPWMIVALVLHWLGAF